MYVNPPVVDESDGAKTSGDAMAAPPSMVSEQQPPDAEDAPCDGQGGTAETGVSDSGGTPRIQSRTMLAEEALAQLEGGSIP